MKYDGVVDLTNKNNSHTMIVDMVGGNKRVLEFGCASGFVSRALRDRGCQVVGVEIDPEFASLAKEFCEEVVIGDAETLDLEAALGDRTFEVAIFGDVLEHLTDPLQMLRRVRKWLVPEGYVVASLPNVAHGAVRLALLTGRFDYRPEGLLDETHVRFFTHDSVKDLFHQAGFVVVETQRTHVGVFETEIELRREDFDSAVVGELESDPEATTYQFVVKGLVDNAFSAAEVVHEREEAQRLEILRLQAELEQLHVEQAAAQAALDAAAEREEGGALERADLERQLARLRAEAEDKDDALANYEAFMARFEQRVPVRLYRRLRRMTGGA